MFLTWQLAIAHDARVCKVALVKSDSLQSDGLQPARLLCPWIL